MHPARLYSNIAFRTAPIVLLAACMGCWEKIEYTGPRATSAPSRTSAPNTTSAQQPLNESPAATSSTSVVDQPVATTGGAESGPPALPPAGATVPPATEAVSPKADDGRYSTPAVAESPPPSPPPPTPEPENSTPSAAAEPARGPTNSTAASATADVAQPASALTSRRAAWLLGSRLSLAALANDRGIAAKNVPIWLEDARTAAKFLGTSIVDLPEPAAAGDTAPASRQVINYLLANGQRIGSELSKQHGADESALFEIALKSNLLLLLYSPGATAGSSIADAISRAAPQAKLPAEYWQPLVDALGKQAPLSDVRAAVRKMHTDVDQYLAQPAEQKGR